MQTIIVKRWTRYGKDRLYISTEDGQRVGWLDWRGHREGRGTGPDRLQRAAACPAPGVTVPDHSKDT